jgi:hypothetical protein
MLSIAMLSSPDTIRSALATAAAALLEATPFLFAGIAVARLLGGRNVIAHLGCGCTSGPSACSLPATAATWLLFGPLVAVARYCAAVLVANLLRRTASPACDEREPLQVLGELGALLPSAALAGGATQLLARFDPSHYTPIQHAAIGAALAFICAPCGLGAIALAGALRIHAPAAAAAFLCVAGIADLRALRLQRSQRRPDHDALAYAMLGVAAGVVAWRHGDALVHPAFVFVLGVCSAAAFFFAFMHRRRQSPAARIAPGVMLVGALIGAPPPLYHATETTLSDLFAGERLSFTGTLACDRSVCAVVRYAITCCRADAAPVVMRLDRMPPYPPGAWLRADGRIDSVGGELWLVAQRIERVAPPSDPFIYR